MTHPDEGPESVEAMVREVQRLVAQDRAAMDANEAALDALLHARGIPCTDYPAPEADDASR